MSHGEARKMTTDQIPPAHHASITGRAYAIWATFWEGEGRLYGRQVARWRGAERRIVARERAAAATVAAGRGRGIPRPAAEPSLVS